MLLEMLGLHRKKPGLHVGPLWVAFKEDYVPKSAEEAARKWAAVCMFILLACALSSLFWGWLLMLLLDIAGVHWGYWNTVLPWGIILAWAFI